MAGSRVHKYKTVFRRVEGLLKSEALDKKDRPLWYDIWERFPPKVEPSYDRKVPTVEVKNILYPEDLIRAKYFDEFVDRDVFNIRKGKGQIHSKAQKFVECYLELQKPGMSPDEIMDAVQLHLNDNGGKYIRKEKKTFVEPKPLFDDIQTSSQKEVHTIKQDWY
ncbi:small ribosomal subunit protein mS23-like [Ruditapes philippinarum]|uniref:small ribosomal subunit protein mS23-like n=1 Tax=Ruditapes philippinarum TaxID=129788 RepID=UPI00295BB094|nr:small ribosomal subunit protein mS23-like [Ruditapes philippinarum]